MRILHFNYEFPPIGGGAGRASAAILKCLAAQGHESLTVTTAWANTPVDEEIAPGMRVWRLPARRRYQHSSRPYEMLSYARQALAHLPQIRQHFKPDVVVSFFGFPSGLAGQKAADVFSCPHVISLRGMDVPGFDEKNLWKHHLFLRPVIRRLWKKAHLLIANSQDLRNRALACAVPDIRTPIVVVENGITIPTNGHLQSAEKTPTIQLLLVGRMAPQKGILSALETLSRPEMRALPWFLEIVGDGPLRKRITKEIRRRNLSDRVVLSGWLDSPQLQHAYARADILLHPSEDEGMSNVMLEAMAHGLVVVAQAVGGNMEVIESSTGYLAPKGRFAEVLQHVMYLYLDKPQAMRELGACAQKKMAQMTWESQAEKFALQLKKVIAAYGESNSVAELNPVLDTAVDSPGM